MKIPKYIDEALKRRTRLAIQLEKTCEMVDEFLDKYSIDAPSEDFHGGVELYVNPYESEESIRKSILEHQNI